MLTRSRKLLQTVVEDYAEAPIPMTGFVNLNAMDKLHLVLCRCRDDPQYAQSLEILVIHFEEQNPPLAAVRELLNFVVSVETLSLTIPFRTSTWIPTVTYQNLTTFKTTIRHQAVRQFLHAHDRLESLVLGPCSRKSICPLKGIALPNLSDLSCPPGCARGLIDNNPVERLVMTYRSRDDLRTSTSSVLKNGLFRTSAKLTAMEANFDPSDSSFFQLISKAAPDLQHLKLTESVWSLSAECSVAAWRRPLVSLSALRSLIVEINGSLAPKRAKEDQIILNALPTRAGKRSRNKRLESVRVLTQAEEITAYLREWSIERSKWKLHVLDAHDAVADVF